MLSLILYLFNNFLEKLIGTLIVFFYFFLLTLFGIKGILIYVFSYFFSFFQTIFLFAFRATYIFLIYTIKLLKFLFSYLLRKITLTIFFFINYIEIRTQVLKLVILRLRFQRTGEKNFFSFSFFQRIRLAYFTFIESYDLLFLFHLFFGYIILFYSIILAPFFYFFRLIFNFTYHSFSLLILFALRFITKFLNFIINVILIKVFYSLVALLKTFVNNFLNFFSALNTVYFKLFSFTIFSLKRRYPFFYGYLFYYKPAYVFLVIYLYLLVLFPLLSQFAYSSLDNYFSILNDNWSWYGDIIPTPSFLNIYLYPKDVLDIGFHGKSAFFYKLGDHADLFLFTIIVSICYFLIFLPKFRHVWFSEQNWEQVPVDNDEDEDNGDEENDLGDSEDPSEINDALNNGEEVFEYFDDLRDKSYVRGRFRNFTVTNGYIIPGDVGWGFFLSFWIFSFYYSIKFLFWPETWRSPGAFDLQEASTSLYNFVETYNYHNFQVYAGWMPGSPYRHFWFPNHWSSWRTNRKAKHFNWPLWNVRFREGNMDNFLKFKRKSFPVGSLGAYYKGKGRRWLLRGQNQGFTGFIEGLRRGLRRKKAYRATDVWYHIYGTYPLVRRNIRFWKRGVYANRSPLNNVYKIGFNYLHYWPKRSDAFSNNIISGSFPLAIRKRIPFNFQDNFDRKSINYLFPDISVIRFYNKFIYNRETGFLEFLKTYDLKRVKKFYKGLYHGTPGANFWITQGDEIFRDVRPSRLKFVRKYDYGITAFHLDAKNTWWFWMDKPLTKDFLYSKYFFSYLKELTPHMNDPYIRSIVYKLWYNYMEGRQKLGFLLSKAVRYKYLSADYAFLFKDYNRMRYLPGTRPFFMDRKTLRWVFNSSYRHYPEGNEGYWNMMERLGFFGFGAVIRPYIHSFTFPYKFSFSKEVMIFPHTNIYPDYMHPAEFRSGYKYFLLKNQWGDSFVTGARHNHLALLGNLEPDNRDKNRQTYYFRNFRNAMFDREAGVARKFTGSKGIHNMKLLKSRRKISVRPRLLHGRMATFLFDESFIEKRSIRRGGGLRGLPYAVDVVNSTERKRKAKRVKLSYSTDHHLYFLRFGFLKYRKSLDSFSFSDRVYFLRHLFRRNKVFDFWKPDFFRINCYMRAGGKGYFPYNLPLNYYFDSNGAVLPRQSVMLFDRKSVMLDNNLLYTRRLHFFEKWLAKLLRYIGLNYNRLLNVVRDLKFFLPGYSLKGDRVLFLFYDEKGALFDYNEMSKGRKYPAFENNYDYYELRKKQRKRRSKNKKFRVFRKFYKLRPLQSYDLVPFTMRTLTDSDRRSLDFYFSFYNRKFRNTLLRWNSWKISPEIFSAFNELKYNQYFNDKRIFNINAKLFLDLKIDNGLIRNYLVSNWDRLENNPNGLWILTDNSFMLEKLFKFALTIKLQFLNMPYWLGVGSGLEEISPYVQFRRTYSLPWQEAIRTEYLMDSLEAKAWDVYWFEVPRTFLPYRGLDFERNAVTLEKAYGESGYDFWKNDLLSWYLNTYNKDYFLMSNYYKWYTIYFDKLEK